ncbi:MAG: phosphodiester glycosidase family protein [Vulcanococcus sp.]
MAGLPALLPLLPLGAGSALLAVALPLSTPLHPVARRVPLAAPPPAPLPAAAPAARPAWADSAAPQALPRQAAGDALRINGLRQQARWQIDGGELWLPLEVLEGQLGVNRRTGSDGGMVLEWFGRRLVVPAGRERSLADEVAVPALPLLQPLGVDARVRGPLLELHLPARPLLGIRSRDLGIGGRRVVFDLAGPSLLRSGDGQLLLGASASPLQRQQLADLGLAPRQQGDWLALQADGQRLSLDGPWRLVLDLPGGGGGGAGTAAGSATDPNGTANRPLGADPRLAQLMGQGLAIERRVAAGASGPVLIHSVRLDPARVPLDLRPLNRPDGMQGLSSLSQLARGESALIAINGGYFNRVNRLPLGALRDGGVWLSGPILNRGAIGWQAGTLPSFGRLSLEESVEDSQGRRWPLSSLNSGYVQKGLARYTSDWGRSYTPISGQEMAVLVRDGRVLLRYEPGSVAGGVPLRPGEELLVARGGLLLPWQPGDTLQVRSRPSHPLGFSPYVIGGGPLLLQGGQLVLNGSAEGFSPGFLGQGAPRTVIASDGRQLWLLTLQGVGSAGPTLTETAVLLQQQGLRDALNLDGGSSTGLVLGQEHTVKGRGVAAAVHNGLGLVPRDDLNSAGGSAARGELLAGP